MTPDLIRKKALELGFDDVGITLAQIPEVDKASYLEWLAQGKQADLAYMEKQIRCDPNCVLEGAKSAILFVSHYKHERLPFAYKKGLIASYARGRDYHNIHARRLKRFINWFEAETNAPASCRGFSDSKPVLERALAVQAGLGWFGKNCLLIHRRFGTFTLISGVFTRLSLPAVTHSTRELRCGICTRCIDACPTRAISPYSIDARLCLSYHLIENSGPVDPAIKALNPGYGFGCDICQDVCPHNVRPALSTNPDFAEQTLYLTEEFLDSNPPLLGTPLKRRGLEGLRMNLNR